MYSYGSFTHWLSSKPGQGLGSGPRRMGCMVLYRTFHTAPEQEDGRTVMYPFSGPGTVVCFNCMSMAFRCPVLVPGTANVKGFCIVSVSVLVPVRDTASVITPLGTVPYLNITFARKLETLWLIFLLQLKRRKRR